MKRLLLTPIKPEKNRHGPIVSLDFFVPLRKYQQKEQKAFVSRHLNGYLTVKTSLISLDNKVIWAYLISNAFTSDSYREDITNLHLTPSLQPLTSNHHFDNTISAKISSSNRNREIVFTMPNLMDVARSNTARMVIVFLLLWMYYRSLFEAIIVMTIYWLCGFTDPHYYRRGFFVVRMPRDVDMGDWWSGRNKTNKWEYEGEFCFWIWRLMILIRVDLTKVNVTVLNFFNETNLLLYRAFS